MDVAGSRVAVVGGSIAGCGVAAAFARLGCDVTVFEASRSDLEDRGAGIVIPLPLRAQLIEHGYLAPDTPYFHMPQRLWITKDGTDPLGRVMWRHPFPGATHNWAVLWRRLRGLVPDDAYRTGEEVRGVAPAAHGIGLELNTGTVEFDVVVGADGYCSRVRDCVHPTVRPAYAGYALWRGNYEESLLVGSPALDVLDGGFASVCYSGGHLIVYLTPGHGGRGERRVNWALYAATPPDLDLREPGSFPPGRVPQALLAVLDRVVDAQLPPAWAALVRASETRDVSVQPIYDHVVPSFATGRVLLVGDAAALSRPHTAAGATKAMQDTLALEATGAAHRSWPDLLAAFDRERCPEATALVETSRLLGRGLVEDTPAWATMSEAEVERYATSLVAGRAVYVQPPAAQQ
ncbi:MAG: FAD-dependent monooxygenase [Sporichthyaceae bacterium]